MTDYAALRRNMVDSQILPNDVTDRRLLRAMGEVPREAFVGKLQKPVAYIDEALKLGSGRWLMAPMPIARLVQLARIEPEQTVLEIGCGTGYISAVLARLAGRVVALESDATLAGEARRSLALLGLGKVKVVEGPLKAGYAAGGPYDAIVVSGSLPEAPHGLAGQVKETGRLVAIVGATDPGRMTVFTRFANRLSGQDYYDAALAPLPGFERAPSFVL
jgi:protein-L-isoaspartate(D-aspartate) O-methyltransferase